MLLPGEQARVQVREGRIERRIKPEELPAWNNPGNTAMAAAGLWTPQTSGFGNYHVLTSSKLPATYTQASSVVGGNK